MKITLDKETISDELYNKLLQHFVNKAVENKCFVTKNSDFANWTIECEFKETKEVLH